MTYAAEYRSGQIQTQIPKVAELVVDIIAKNIQKEHITDNMPKTTVQKSVSYKLPQTKFTGSKHKVRNPGAKCQAPSWGYMQFQRKNNHINKNQCVICVWRPPRSYTCPVG